MKTLILFIFFASLFYYLRPTDKPIVVDLDEIRVKVSAPKRAEKPKTHRHITRTPSHIEDDGRVVSEVAQDLIEANSSIEEGWENQLKNRLLELDPMTGEEIFELYKQEKNSYATTLENLVRDHQESEDLDHLIDELDHSHQQRLQDIFGPYFEDLRDLQGQVTQ